MRENGITVRGVRLLVNEPEACDLLHVSRSALRVIVAQGLIKPLHVGKSLRFSYEDIADFVAKLAAEGRVPGRRG